MKTLRFIAPALVFASAANATLLLQENFDSLSTADGGALNGQNGWTAQSGVSVAAGGLNYNNGAISINGGANRVQSNAISPGTSTPLANTSFTPQSGEVWFSFTMLVDTSAVGARYWFWVSDAIDLNTGVTGSVTDNNSNNKNFFPEIRLSSTPVSPLGGTITEDSVYFFVARLSKDGSATNANAYDRMELWVNPNSTSVALGSGVVANSAATASFTGGIQYFGLTALTSAAALQWDNLRIGTSQADVLGVYAVPEPSSFAALAGLGALGLVATRRRRAAR